VFERIKLVERRIDLRLLNLLRRGGGYHCRIGFEAVKGRNLARQRAQRSDLNVAFFGDLFQTRIAVFELILLGTELVVVCDFLQHPGIRAGNSSEAERADRCARQKNV
jgi:hypothetical protein